MFHTTLPYGVFVVDFAGNILSKNKYAESLLLKNDSLINKKNKREFK